MNTVEVNYGYPAFKVELLENESIIKYIRKTSDRLNIDFEGRIEDLYNHL